VTRRHGNARQAGHQPASAQGCGVVPAASVDLVSPTHQSGIKISTTTRIGARHLDPAHRPGINGAPVSSHEERTLVVCMSHRDTQRPCNTHSNKATIGDLGILDCYSSYVGLCVDGRWAGP
jgi:hypothetical protein